ncbi:hypothetical protein [Subtercola endophyticus]|uniref:hypothetical protein n=1 Tax=Subtercola endophyticus TaxID=2895559 RepID=UPI001E65D04E|nr:hypothetical protein [Subtercola endophyticus]UFS57842.1 hypothetical protein LQ955_12420 [Subtercola endophyticus]
MSLDAPTPGISRRSLVKAAAWTAPVVALAVAVPGAAASDSKPEGDLGILYFEANNTWGQFIRGGGVIVVNGNSSNETVTSILVTLDFGTGFAASEYFDNTGDSPASGWVRTKDFSGGTVEYTYEGVPLIPYAKPGGIGFGFTVTGTMPTTLSVTAVSSQANFTAGIYTIPAAG